MAARRPETGVDCLCDPRSTAARWSFKVLRLTRGPHLYERGGGGGGGEHEPTASTALCGLFANNDNNYYIPWCASRVSSFLSAQRGW